MPIKVLKNESLESVFECKAVSQENEGEAHSVEANKQTHLVSYNPDHHDMKNSFIGRSFEENEGEFIKVFNASAEQALKPTYEQLESRLANALRRCDEHREAELAADKRRAEDALRAGEQIAELTVEYERRMEKSERAHEIEIRNLKHERAMQDKALEKHAEDEQLIGMLLRKAGSYAERFAE